MGDRHPQTRTLHLGRPVIVCPAERLKHDLLEFGRHADAVICNRKLVAAKLREAIRLFFNRECDIAAIRGVLDGVAHQVYKDLLDPQAVAADGLVFNTVHMDFKIMSMLIDGRLCKGNQVIDQLRQIKVLLGKGHLSAFDARHVQHFIDQSQQMAARLGGFAKALDHLIRILDIRTCNRCQANDCIHRRPNIMGHIGEELRLGPVCILRRAVGLLQRPVGFNLGPFLL